jgi:hypothetical protein
VNGEYGRKIEAITVAEDAARAQAIGVTLMVKSLVAPFYSVPYPEFAQQVLDRREERGETDADAPITPESAEELKDL